MNKYKVTLQQGNLLDFYYRKMVETLMKVSDIDKSEIIDRKDKWEESVNGLKTYEVILELTEKEYNELRKNFNIEKINGGNINEK